MQVSVAALVVHERKACTTDHQSHTYIYCVGLQVALLPIYQPRYQV